MDHALEISAVTTWPQSHPASQENWRLMLLW
jgi:hypothetical protein